METRTTPREVKSLKEGQVFVFGSNTAGRHSTGTELTALNFGAKMGRGHGLEGWTYAIPVRDRSLKVLPVFEILRYVIMFIDFATAFPNKTFIVTEIGCGDGEYTPEEIAISFSKAKNIENIHLPQSFWDIINKKTN